MSEVSLCSFWRTQTKKSRTFAIVLLIMQISFIKMKIGSCLIWSNWKNFFGFLYLRALRNSNLSLEYYMVSRIFQRSFCRTHEHEVPSIYQSFYWVSCWETREERWKHDKFACMRYIFDEPNCKFATKIETQTHF